MGITIGYHHVMVSSSERIVMEVKMLCELEPGTRFSFNEGSPLHTLSEFAGRGARKMARYDKDTDTPALVPCCTLVITQS